MDDRGEKTAGRRSVRGCCDFPGAEKWKDSGNILKIKRTELGLGRSGIKEEFKTLLTCGLCPPAV